jgi:DNA-binding LacI/PurR family transcriptional regulator
MYVARCRLDGYRQAVEETGTGAGRGSARGTGGGGADDALVAHADFTEEGGRRAMRELLERRPDIDGVFAASDLMAAGARAVLRESGRRVPEDVALVGFEDSVIARHMDPPLTSVRQPTEEMGRTMARVLLEEIAERASVRRHVVLATELVQRDSV